LGETPFVRTTRVSRYQKRQSTEGKSEEKKINGEANDINKQTYIVPKTKNRIKGTLCLVLARGYISCLV